MENEPPLPDGRVAGPDGHPRCFWGAQPDDYRRYHDEEWGRPVADDRRLFEKICLEGFQAGLSWLTILRKRARFRAVFRDFDFETLAGFGEPDVVRLLADPGIVRHRKKIESVLHNSRRAVELRDEFGSLAAYFWSWEPEPSARPPRLDGPTIRALAQTTVSSALSRDLKRRGWRFVGPTTVYAFMQAMGLVNDHVAGCAVREAVETDRRSFPRPRR